MSATVLRALAATVRGAVHLPGQRDCACPAPGAVLADREDAAVVRHGEAVAKAHAPGTDPRELALRTALAAHPALGGILLPPLRTDPVELHGRPVTLWPHGEPVDPEHPEAAPWEAAARLLARLHRTDPSVLPSGLPAMRGPARAARAVARLRARAAAHPAAPAVLAAWSALPPWARGEAPVPGSALCHGDVHLGQLVREPGGGWVLIDVDDLGTGHPAWDLARPAAWYACGILGPGEWARFLSAYRSAGGPAVPPEGDPWPVLDVPARAVTVQSAALALVKATGADRALDEAEQSMTDACVRMAGLAPGPAGAPGRPA
ncbi:phosphotransferase [Streptomyces sp. SCSIO ZS0520]|uniref:phosphotransferase n=1 Tax=Streptomyces sp. SCSIO ZS0520 TaxID=2892996 RepID=UPI0039860CCC